MKREDAQHLLGFAVGPGWSFQAIRRGGEVAAFVMQMGSEVHVHRVPAHAGHWLTRGDIERLLLPILHKYGEVTTRVRADNLQGQRFVQRLGFERVGEHDGIQYFRALRFNHARL